MRIKVWQPIPILVLLTSALAPAQAQQAKERLFINADRSIRAVSFSPDGKTLASCGDEGVKLWDPSDGKEKAFLERVKDWHWALAYAPNGVVLAVAEGRLVRLLDPGTLKEKSVLKGHPSSVYGLAFSLDGKRLAVCGGSGPGGGRISVFDLAAARIQTSMKTDGEARHVAFSPDGKMLVSGGGGNVSEVRLWNPSNGEELKTLKGPTGQVQGVTFATDGKTFIVGTWRSDEGGEVKLWNVAHGKEEAFLKGSVSGGGRLALANDGKTLAAVARGYAVLLWDLKSRKEITIYEHPRNVSALVFSPDGKTLATGDGNGSIRLWDVPLARSK